MLLKAAFKGIIDELGKDLNVKENYQSGRRLGRLYTDFVNTLGQEIDKAVFKPLIEELKKI